MAADVAPPGNSVAPRAEKAGCRNERESVILTFLNLDYQFLRRKKSPAQCIFRDIVLLQRLS